MNDRPFELPNMHAPNHTFIRVSDHGEKNTKRIRPTVKVCRTDTKVQQLICASVASSWLSPQLPFATCSPIERMLGDDRSLLSFRNSVRTLRASAMKAKLLLTLFTLSVSGSGCALNRALWQTTIVQPRQYCSDQDERREERHFRQLAKIELERAKANARAESDDYARDPFSIDEEQGFEDGFVDYAVYGGTGEPPPLPPRRYWRANCQSGCGHRAIEDWFNGFRQGAAVAKTSGYRDCVTLPLSDLPLNDTLPSYAGQASGFDCAKSGSSTEPINKLPPPSEFGIFAEDQTAPSTDEPPSITGLTPALPSLETHVADSATHAETSQH